MSFQSTVSLIQGFGVIGELYDNSPYRSQVFNIVSDDATYNVFGRAFTIVDEATVKAGGTGIFAGIMACPKQNALLGTQAGGSLAPSLTLPNNAQADFVTMGRMIVSLPAAAAIGDLVVFNTTTGALATISPSGSLGAGQAFAYATVSEYTVAGAGLAVIELTPTLTIPA